MAKFAIEYTYGADLLAVRDEHRPRHRQWLQDRHEAGDILLVGPYTDGTGALLIVAADDERAAAQLVAQDPFAEAGAIDAVRITEWMEVFGPFGG